MWVLSVLDLYDATANVTALGSFAPWIEQRLDHAESILQAWDGPDGGRDEALPTATGSKQQQQQQQQQAEAEPAPHAADCCANPSLDWSRDDDRMGFGFESPNLPEARHAFRALIIGASAR
jgi:hypothetical protein